MRSRLPVLLLFLSTLTIAVLYGIALFHPLGKSGLLVLATAISLATTSIMAFGLPRNSRRARIVMSFVLVLTFLIVAAGLCIAIIAGAPHAGDRLYFGLPLGAAVVVFVVCLVPLVVLPFIYAYTFDGERP